ncbi:phage tail protein [Allostreptomyces psammosilenae]|uniref:Phage tail-like protein n=1 Tax=Allostreptomyces psammosilenae TaxID=1892865 RepID=A0A852ZNC2_9ACTN|nr:phage tail protein [Allostreptomyces psammosilenae]NYI03899.1 phage tail-like protein [Allostreptomyces psammosilenae]
MRGTVPGLPTPHPLLHQLPAVYLDHDFLERFLGALDEVLAPVLLVLDNLPAHLDPRTAPEDLLDWIAGWVAAQTDPERPVERRRETVTRTVRRHQLRGTRRGLAEAVRLETGVSPQIVESGAASWSATPLAPLPGEPGDWVTVRVRVPDPERVDRARLERLVADEVPAHVRYRVEVLPADGAAGSVAGGAS